MNPSELQQYPSLRASWLLSLLKLGLLPDVEIIEECHPKVVDDRERFWIAHYRKFSKLTNMTDGGDGGATITGRKLGPRPLKVRLKISKIRKAQGTSYLTFEQRKARGRAIADARKRNGTTNKGKRWKCSEEARKKFSELAKKRVLTQKGRAQIIAARYGKGNKKEIVARA